MPDIIDRHAAARRIAADAGAMALGYFRQWDRLTVGVKGQQVFVSEADRNVELSMRAALAAAFPGDAIVGEEAAPRQGTGGFTWVIDPSVGIANFMTCSP